MSKKDSTKETALKAVPYGDFILVKNEEAEKQTKSGLILTTDLETNVIAEVIATGPGLFSAEGVRIPMQASVGCKVMYPKGHGAEVTLDGEKYIIIREANLLMIIGNE